MRLARRLFLAPWWLLPMVACTGDPPGGSGADAGVDAPGFGQSEVSGPEAVAAEEIFVPEPGEFGYPCDGPEDCNSEYCILTALGHQCTTTCNDACPEGYACRQLSSTDPVYLCLPLWVTLCDPCQTAANCRSGETDTGQYCVDWGAAGKFCGADCSDGKCPKGYSCEQVPVGQGQLKPQCVPDSGQCDCSPLAIEAQLATTCAVANDDGVCKGSRICTPDGLSACSALAPAVEGCNGLDDDCNGVTDDLTPGYTCFKVNGYGTCPGSGTCIQGVELCEGKEASPEICDGLDNNCDNQTDEGSLDTDLDGQADCIDEDDDDDTIPDVGDNCPITPNTDQQNHDSDPQGDACDGDDDNDNSIDEVDCKPFDPNIYPGAVELCDGIDNDCNSLTDDNLCNDANSCTEDACNADGSCAHTPLVGACNDGTVCTENDTCIGGACVGSQKNCDDGILCTKDSCDPVAGCSNLMSPGMACDDGSPCTAQDKCDAQGLCSGKFDNTACDDGNPCTLDTCNPMLVNPCLHDSKADGASCASAGIAVGQCQEPKCIDGVCLAQPGNEGKGCQTGNGDCPQGNCSNGGCYTKSGQTCLYEGDFCQQGEVPGQCAASGECVPVNDPSCKCGTCAGICFCCYLGPIPLAICFPI